VDRKLIEKFLKDECNPHENLELLDWLMTSGYMELEKLIEDDLNNELKDEIESERDLSYLLPDIYKSEDLYKNLNLYLPQESLTTFADANKKPKRLLWLIAKCAASIIFIVGFAYLFYSNLTTTQSIQSAGQTDYLTKSNQRGRKSTIHLKDGSIVYLNSESKITYPTNFPDSVRVVQLNGEAFFDIAKNESKPFIVISGPLQVKVLGTSFNIKAFKDEDEIKVSIASGQVELSYDNSEGNIAKHIELSSNQAVVYNLNEKVFNKITSFHPIKEFGWKDGIIYFNKAGLITVINKLERWYDVHIEIKNDPSFIWSYTGKFQNATLENVLNSIGHTERFNFRIEQDKVIIKFKTDDYDTHP